MRKRNWFFRKAAACLVAAVCACSVLASGAMTQTAEAAEDTWRNTYGVTFEKSGTAVTLAQMKDANELKMICDQYTSVTLGNEMKPDYMLGGRARLQTTSEAKEAGYHIPSGYSEDTVPKISFSVMDATMKICYQNNLGLRGHTFVWHSQTPDWFFREGYTANGAYVKPAVMDRRMEMYIKTIMEHAYDSPYGSVLYAWDVVNEYLHAENSSWERVYGNCGHTPEFCKKAFRYAHEVLEEYGLTDEVELYFNDYNTYMEVQDILDVVKYINSDGKICDGIGMQSHLDTNFPSPDYYIQALTAFLKAGYKVQITELDITCTDENTQTQYTYELLKKICQTQKKYGNITAFVWWGTGDDTSWRSSQKPLMFSKPGQPKSGYEKTLQAYHEVFGAGADLPDPVVVPAEDGFFYDTFEEGCDDWGPFGSPVVDNSRKDSYKGDHALLTSNRDQDWQGCAKTISTNTYKGGTAYSFGAWVKAVNGYDPQEFSMTLKYVNAQGNTDYAGIGSVKVAAGEWGQIKNESFTIPEGASDMMIYIETPKNTCDFYVDEAFSAPEGEDPTTGSVVEPTKKPTVAPTKKPTVTPTKKPTVKPTQKPQKKRVRYADLDLDGSAHLFP